MCSAFCHARGRRPFSTRRPPRAALTSALQWALHFAILCAVLLAAATPRPAVAERCTRGGGYDPGEIARSAFFTTREQTKFAPTEPHYPLAQGAAARYCFSRGCTGQLTVRWSADEQRRLRALRDAVVSEETAPAELAFIRLATLQMETWLYMRLSRLDPGALGRIKRKVATHYGAAHSDAMSWMTATMSAFDPFDKECATYAMEATQHLLVLANLGLLRHWNVTAPVYRVGFPGHWTAGLESRATCERYRLDLNTRASARYALHARGQDPAALALADAQRYGALLPGMDRAGMGRPTAPIYAERPAGSYALRGPRAPAASSQRAR